jgi:HPt (histidine-containing phosphotransfer) domain-containing protein
MRRHSPALACIAVASVRAGRCISGHQAMSENGALLDPQFIEEIRQIERATGRTDVLVQFVTMLEEDLAAFVSAFPQHLARGDAAQAASAAHKMKGACRQLGAHALGELFAEVEATAKAGNVAEAGRRFEAGSSLIGRSIQALKQA